MANRVWFITGASQGFGMELTRAALEAGDKVIATARNPKTIEDAFGKQDGLLALRLDVTNEQQAKEAVNAALKRFGHIDILVNNAGRGLVGAVEEVTAEEVRSAIAVNVEGTLNVSRAALPSMRARRSGHILNLSSVGGFASWPGWGIYCATKFMSERIFLTSRRWPAQRALSTITSRPRAQRAPGPMTRTTLGLEIRARQRQRWSKSPRSGILRALAVGRGLR